MQSTVRAGVPIVFLCLASAAAAQSFEAWVREGLAGESVIALAVAPADPRLVYAGTMAGHVFRSDDAGRIWSPVSSGLPGGAVRALAVDPFDPLRVFAGTSQGLYRSGDAGQNWALSGTGLPTEVVALAIDPVDPAVVWVSTTEPGLLHLYRSSDGGERWDAITIQGPGFGTPAFGWVVTLAFRLGTSTLFAGWHDVLFFFAGTGGWDLYPDFQAEVSSVVPDPFDAALVHIGTLGRGAAASSDNRSPWRFGGGLDGANVSALAADPTAPGLLYAASGDAVFRSLDHGATWMPAGTPLPSPGVLAVSPDGSAVRVGTADGVRRLEDRPRSSPRLPVEPVRGSRTPLLLNPRD